MFGYVVVNKPELKIKDFTIYQSFYCGLCRSLHKEFGRTAQLTLNFDLTFVAILLTALYEPETAIFEEHCVLHPIRKHTMLSNKYIDYAADMTILLTYLKCVDDWKDEKRYRSACLCRIWKHRYLRVKKQYPKKVEHIEQALEQIMLCEQQQCYDLDKISSLFGIVMGEIMVYTQDEWSQNLYEIGDYLGRFIYIMDAYDDVEDDMKKHMYNPFCKDYKDDGFDDRIHAILELMIAQSADAFEILPILQYTDLLRNIFYSGIWAKYEMIRKKRLGEHDGRSI